MENLNAEQIIKALECHRDDQNCVECPYTDERECHTILSKNALALITSQKQRIKELAEEAYRLECDLQLNADEKAVAKAIEQTKKATVRKMQERLMEKILENTVGNDSFAYFLKSFIDQIAKEMLEGANETV